MAKIDPPSIALSPDEDAQAQEILDGLVSRLKEKPHVTVSVEDATIPAKVYMEIARAAKEAGYKAVLGGNGLSIHLSIPR